MKAFPLTCLVIGLSLPCLAQEGPGNEVEVPSTLSYNLRIATQGEPEERGNVITARWGITRFGVRETLQLLEDMRFFGPVSEGAELEPFPRGSRLQARPDGAVWVVDRTGEFVFNATPYIDFFFLRDRMIVNGTFNTNTQDTQQSRVAVGGIEIDFGSLLASVEGEEGIISDFVEVDGVITERYTLRFNSRNSSSQITETISGAIDGSGFVGGANSQVTGNINTNGRDTIVED